MADAGYLRYEIAEYPLSYFMRGDNDVKVTMQDIATRCGVSKSLVSRVLNNDLTLRISNDTRTKIIEEIEKTGYIRDPNAQGLANKKGNVNPPGARFGYVTFASQANLGHPYFSHIVEGIMEAVGKSNCRLVMSATINEFNSNIEMLTNQFSAENQLDGIILLGKIEIPALREAIKQIARYVVCMEEDYDKESDFVGVNLNNSIKLAIDYLISLGYRDIGLIFSSKNQNRFQWCKYVMECSGLAFHPDWMIDGEYTINVTYSRVKAALQAYKPPRAIVAWNDEMALGCIKALTESGYKVPEDVAVVGHDDIAIAAYTDVPLTTVRIYKKEIGTLAVKILLDRIESKRKIPIKVEIPGRLIKRDSCGRKLKKTNG